MMKLTWNHAVIVGCLILIGILLAQLCNRPDITVTPDYTVITDSIKTANKQAQERIAAITDSIDLVVKEKDRMYADKDRKLREITEKYIRLRAVAPDKDTVVKIVEVYDGSECLEKLPIIQAKLDIVNGQVAALKYKAVAQSEHIKVVQSQLDRSLSVNTQQGEDIRKLKRRVRWQKIGLVSEAVVALGLVVFVAAQ